LIRGLLGFLSSCHKPIEPARGDPRCLAPLVATRHRGRLSVRELHICVMNADGTGRAAIVTSVGEQETASFSRDGSRIVFQSFGQNPKAAWCR